MQESTRTPSDCIGDLRRGILTGTLAIALLAVALAAINFATANNQRLLGALQATVYQEFQILVTLQRNISFLLRTADSSTMPQATIDRVLEVIQQESTRLKALTVLKNEQLARLRDSFPLSWFRPVETDRFTSPAYKLFLSGWIDQHLDSDDPLTLLKTISSANPFETAFVHKGFSNTEFTGINQALTEYFELGSKLQNRLYIVSAVVLLGALLFSLSWSIAPALRRLKEAEQQANERLELSNTFSEVIALLATEASQGEQSWENHIKATQDILDDKLPGCRISITAYAAEAELAPGGDTTIQDANIIQRSTPSGDGGRLLVRVQHPQTLNPFRHDLSLFVERLSSSLEHQYSVHIKLGLEQERDAYFSYAATAVRHMPVALGIFTSAGTLMLSNDLLWEFLLLANEDKRKPPSLTQALLKELFCSTFTNDRSEFDAFFTANGSKYLHTRVDQRTIRWSWVTVDLEGWILIGQDISSDLTLQTEKQHLSQLEALGRVSGGVAHDMNNFLAIVLNNIEMASMEINNERVSGFLQNALAACNGAAKTNEQLLSYARKQPLAAQQLGAPEIVSAVEDFFTQAGRSGDIVWEIETEDNIWADKQHLLSAILNVTKNAIEITDKGQQITVSISDYTAQDDNPDTALIEQMKTQEMIQIQVRDQGGGFSRQALDRGLEPFFTTKATGTGLGLAAVLGFAEQSGGSVSIQNRNGGAVVNLILPKAPASVPNPGYPGFTTEQDSLLDNDSLVLLIDDNTRLLEVTNMLLVHMGFKVLTASSLQTAMDRLRTERFDLIVTDMALQDGSGHDVAVAAREVNPMIPIVYISGYISDQRFQPNKDRQSAFLKKPFTMDALQSAISRAVAATAEAAVSEY